MMIPPDHDARVLEAGLAHHVPGERKAGTRRTLLACGGVLYQPRGRRLLLRATATGMAMAAGGLFLPNWLQKSAARDGALAGDKGGRRGRNHRGLHRRRSHGANKDKPRGGGPIKARPIMFLVDMYGTHAQVKADLYSTRLRPGHWRTHWT